jgi:hypothetical protein
MRFLKFYLKFNIEDVKWLRKWWLILYSYDWKLDYSIKNIEIYFWNFNVKHEFIDAMRDKLNVRSCLSNNIENKTDLHFGFSSHSKKLIYSLNHELTIEIIMNELDKSNLSIL